MIPERENNPKAQLFPNALIIHKLLKGTGLYVSYWTDLRGNADPLLRKIFVHLNKLIEKKKTVRNTLPAQCGPRSSKYFSMYK